MLIPPKRHTPKTDTAETVFTDARYRGAKPSEKPYRLYDGSGLYLQVMPEGGKYWRWKYRLDGKEKVLALGVYPDVSLKSARERRDEARALLVDGIDPSLHRQAAKAARAVAAANTFEAVAREWYEKMVPTWNAAHGDRIIRRLERDVFPYIGRRPIKDIEPVEVLPVLRRIEKRGAVETAHRCRVNLSQVWRYAVATGRASRDAVADLKGALAPAKIKHLAAVTDPEELGRLLVMLDGYAGTPTVQVALRLAPMLLVRPGELRHARWAEIDLDAGEWRFILSKTKAPHLVPLALQAVALLRELEPLTGMGRSEYVFHSARSIKRPMSDNAVLAAMRRQGIPSDVMTGHGFRATARTILDEVLGVRVDLIEHQLGHAVRDTLGRAYNRTQFISERRAMMQRWADYLDELRRMAGGQGSEAINQVTALV
jgi:integrase